METNPTSAPSSTIDPGIDLGHASVEDLLRYALDLTGEDLCLGIVAGTRDALALITELTENLPAQSSVDAERLQLVLEGLGRRLDVAVELQERARRRASEAAPTGAAPEEAT